MAQCPFGEQQKSPTLAQGLTDLILTHATEIENTKMQKYDKIKGNFFCRDSVSLFLMDSTKIKNPKKKNYENVKAQNYYL